MAKQPHVAIIGGGIGGLFAANALIAQGIEVTVYEQAPALGEIGAGVYMTPNAVRHLQRVGLGAAIEKSGARVGADSHYFRHDGAPIAPVQVTDASGNPCFGMHRADLVELLAANLPAGVVHTGHRAVGFTQNANCARVTFASGEVDMIIASIPAATPLLTAKRVRSLGVTTGQRTPLAPNMPTLAEQGLTGFDRSGWYGMLAPTGTPRDIIMRLNAAIVKIVNTPEIRDAYMKQGLDPATSSPEEFGVFIRGEIAQNIRLVKAAGFKVE